MSAPPLYKIANWHALYEGKDSARTTGPMKWIPVPTKTDGYGFGLLRQESNRAELLAAWYLILGVAAKQPRELRGLLMRDGFPLTADDLELMTGFPAKMFVAAFAFFTQPKQGWLVVEESAQNAASCGQNAASCGASSADCALHYITLQDSRVEDMTVEQNAAGAAPAVVIPPKTAATGQPAANAAKTTATAPKTDAEWLNGLKSNAAYQGIDVAREHAKAQVWCENKRRVLTRARFINWLNRAERPMAGRATMR